MAFEKLKRNLGRAFSMESNSRIRNRVDNDETSENLDFMLSKGKSKKVKEHNAGQTEEGLKIRRRAMYDVGLGDPAK
jgi:hypothetical protein